MIDTKIKQAEDILAKRGVEFTWERGDDISGIFYLFLKEGGTIDDLIKLFTIIDDLNFRTLYGCDVKVDIYDLRGVGCIRMRIKEKPSNFYGLPPNKTTYKTTTTTSNQEEDSSKKQKTYIDPLKDFLISDYQKLEFERKSVSVRFNPDDIADIEDLIMTNYYGYQGPFSDEVEYPEIISFKITDPVEPKNREMGDKNSPAKYPNSIDIKIQKYLRDIFIVSEVQNFDRGTKRRYFKCQGYTQLDELLYGIGFFNLNFEP
jgi:hypothetical protein